ncbi:MAG TPA: hypothetical protein VKY19_00645 [Ktedonosporobacter sp.]|nr:hypothetical protein [Ktedonosporobacter sp.]
MSTTAENMPDTDARAFHCQPATMHCYAQHALPFSRAKCSANYQHLLGLVV